MGTREAVQHYLLCNRPVPTLCFSAFPLVYQVPDQRFRIRADRRQGRKYGDFSIPDFVVAIIDELAAGQYNVDKTVYLPI